MNGKFEKTDINYTMVFQSEKYRQKTEMINKKLYAEISELIEKNNAVMFTWNDKKAEYKRIFFPFKDQNGRIRIAHIINDIPYSHTYDIKQEIHDLISTLNHHEIFYKTA